MCEQVEWIERAVETISNSMAGCSEEDSFPWRYKSVWVLVCSTILLHAFLSIAILLQFWTLILPISSLISSSNLNLGVPILTAIGLHFVILLTVFYLSALTTHVCLIRLILCARVYRTITACLNSKSILAMKKIMYDFSSSISGGESSFETRVCRTKTVS